MAEQPTHHFILTLQVPSPNGFAVCEFSNAITPPAGWTRAQLFKGLRDQIKQDHPEYRGATTIFFSLERNQL
ncbi:hypothetical protein [Streptomyces sp. CA2R106]|uniref:hypothetical protein n=1 Tax=Streptomyces sp. CA2R106 TaxID=3120153 RepID=UPI003008D81E